jgi:hypothetical protein
VHVFDGYTTLSVRGKRDCEFAVAMQAKVRMVIGNFSDLGDGAHQDDRIRKRWPIEGPDPRMILWLLAWQCLSVCFQRIQCQADHGSSPCGAAVRVSILAWIWPHGGRAGG